MVTKKFDVKYAEPVLTSGSDSDTVDDDRNFKLEMARENKVCFQHETCRMSRMPGISPHFILNEILVFLRQELQHVEIVSSTILAIAISVGFRFIDHNFLAEIVKADYKLNY